MPVESCRVEAAAKVNLSLQVKSLDGSGMHPLLSLAQSFDCCDRLSAALADENELDVGDADLPSGSDNLIWQAVEVLKNETDLDRPVSFVLSKRIPVAAGLAGGSADAAAALVAVSELLGVPPSTIQAAAARVGADVPFCLQGGLAWMEGHGQRLTAIEQIPADYAVAVVVPPFVLNTGSVYRHWDRLDEPRGETVDGRHLPPSLRQFEPFVNDLYPAALDLRPDLGDWRAELTDRWARPVMLSGSGPALFAYFENRAEATEATGVASDDARARFAASPVSFGVRLLADDDWPESGPH